MSFPIMLIVFNPLSQDNCYRLIDAAMMIKFTFQLTIKL